MELVKKVLEFEKLVSGEVEERVKKEIEELKSLEDVKEYYLEERDWGSDKSMVEVLYEFISELKKEM